MKIIFGVILSFEGNFFLKILKIIEKGTHKAIKQLPPPLDGEPSSGG